MANPGKILLVLMSPQCVYGLKELEEIVWQRRMFISTDVINKIPTLVEQGFIENAKDGFVLTKKGAREAICYLRRLSK